MKKYIPLLLPLSFFIAAFIHAEGNQENAASQKFPFATEDLQPNLDQAKVENLIVGLLTNYHYKKVDLNDSLSSVIFDNLLDDFDPNKTFYIQSDIDEFENYRYKVDDFLKLGDLSLPYYMYNRFHNRSEERFNYIKTQLTQMPDFSIDESYSPDREEAPYAKSTEELDDFWRKELKRILLDEKISGLADSTILKNITNRYNRTEKYLNKTNSDDVFQMVMNAFTNAIDPHTNYMNPKNANEFNKDMSQAFDGIGASLRLEGDYITIKELIPGGPAFRGGELKPEDRIVGVAQGENGEYVDVVGWFTDDVVQIIRGERGSLVRLKILPAKVAPGTLPHEVKIIREKIKIEEQTAKSDILEFKDENGSHQIGVITLPMFYRDFDAARKDEKDFNSTTKDVEKYLNEYKEKGVDGVIIDLRNNGGGSLTEAIELTGLFIPHGPVVQRKQSDGNISAEYDRDQRVVYSGPLAVLTNGFSASASEIFAGAIQDYKRGIIVGGQTYGKGTVQSVVNLDNYIKSSKSSGILKLTLEKFYRVTGSSTQRKGVMPDFKMPSSYSAEEFGEDSQKSALPWDQIPSSNFTPTNTINKEIMTSLSNQFKKDLMNDEKILELKDEIEKWKERRAKNLVSLNYEVRKKEIEEQKNDSDLNEEEKAEKEADKKLDEKALAHKRLSEDIFIIESQRLLSEWINISKEEKLVISK
ncbi:MAG: C-terminal processing peptidase [Bacteroidota bacterium]|jgi:carboxyl-terminal processing protease